MGDFNPPPTDAWHPPPIEAGDIDVCYTKYMHGVELMNEVKRRFFSAAAGALAGSVILMLFMALVSALLLKAMAAGDAALAAAGMLCAAAGAFAGGFLASRLSRSAGLVTGAVCGTLMFLLILTINIPLGNIPGAVSLLRALIMILSGSFGGVCGVGGKRRRRKRRK